MWGTCCGLEYLYAFTMNLNPSNGAFLFRDRLTRDRTRANTGSPEILGMSGRKSASEGAMSGSGVYPAGGVPQKVRGIAHAGAPQKNDLQVGRLARDFDTR